MLDASPPRIWTILGVCAALVPFSELPAQDDFRRGDADGDGRVDIADVAAVLAVPALELSCPDAADVDDDGLVSLADAVVLVEFLFLGGEAPAAPGGMCGPDPTLDALPACTYPAGSCEDPPPRTERAELLLSFLGDPDAIAGEPGERVRIGEFQVGLCSGDGPAGGDYSVQAWSLAIETSGCSAITATTAGTAGAESELDPLGMRSGGFERTEVVTGGIAGTDSGIASAVVLSYVLPIALPEEPPAPDCAPHILLRFELDAEIPPIGQSGTCALAFTGGIRGSAEPVDTVVVTPEGGFLPTLAGREIEVALPAPPARIDGPARALLLGDSVTVSFDGRASMAGEGLLRFFEWSVTGAGAQVLRARDEVTEVSFREPGVFQVELAVLRVGDLAVAGTAVHEIEIRRPQDVEPSAPVFVDPVPAPPAALTERPFSLPLALSGGNPAPEWSLSKTSSPGLAVRSDGRLEWRPAPGDAGTHELTVVARNVHGKTSQDITLEVVDRYEAVASFAVGREGAAPGEGGGASEEEAPRVLGDGSKVDPALELYLEIAPGSSEGSVREVVPDAPGKGDDAFAALRFRPQAAVPPPPGEPFGAAYRSGASASKLFQHVIEGSGDFTVELWLSNVPSFQVGATDDAPATVVALMSREGDSASWQLGRTASGEYTMAVRASPEDVELAVSDGSAGELHHLVFVRSGDRHSFFIDGVETLALEQEGVLDWEIDQELFLANDATLAHPFTGDLHLVSIYPEALSAAHIFHLFELRLEEPPEPNPPAVAICPDPYIIGRGAVRLFAEVDAFGGVEGAAAGVRPDCAGSDIRSLDWSWTAQDPAGELDSGALRLEPAPTADPCIHRLEVLYDPGMEETVVEIRLDAAQVPVRGLRLTNSASFVIELPARRLFRRGDANRDGILDISDPLFLLGTLFLTEEAIHCEDAADTNDDDLIDLSDAISVLDYLFTGGARIPAPGPLACGEDPLDGKPSADRLDCAEYPRPQSTAAECPSD